MATFHSLIAPNHNHLSAIGRVVVLWTFLEKTIETLVWKLASLQQPKAQAVTTHLQTLILIDTANSLARESLASTGLDKKLRQQLSYIVQKLRPKRNSIVHGIWAPTGTPDKVIISETTARGVLKFKVSEEMSVEDILQVASEIDEANFQLTNLAFEIAKHLKQAKNVYPVIQPDAAKNRRDQ